MIIWLRYSLPEMIAPPPHPEEELRLRRLAELGVLDTPPSEAFDRITRLASRLFGVPIALVSLVDANRQWFKSRVGLEARETGRDISFCSHAVAQNEMLVIEDAPRDTRFADNPLVVGPPHIRFYAGALLRSGDGLPLGTLCVIDRAPRDFGEAERSLLADLAGVAEAELRRAGMLETLARNLGRDRQMRTILGLLPDAAFACDSRGTILATNPAAKALFGWRIRDMLGKPALALFADGVESPGAAEPDGEAVRECRRAEGTTFPGRVRWRRLAFDEAELRVFTVSDMSEWLERERRLAEQAQLLEMARDAIIVTDAANVVTFWNRGAEAMYGISRDRALGKDMGLLVVAGPDHGRAERFAEILERSGYWEGDLKHRRADGTALTVFSRWSVRRDQEGTVRVLKINTDVTARKEVEQLKDEFVSVVNHELRTPLTSILGALELLSEYPGDGIADEPRELVEMARRNAERLTRLVNDVLDIEKIAAGKVTYRCAAVPVAVALAEAIECVRGPLEQQAGRVEVIEEPGASGVHALADRDRLVQVLTNLLSNAIKFSPHAETVTVRIRTDCSRVRVSVADRGPGIPASFAERIFERFAQAETPLTRSSEGSGLGLAICKGIMAAMSGSIGYESPPGEGATFHIELPLAR